MRLAERLTEIDKLLANLRLSAIIDSGTLLGLTREGELIPGDNDLDLSALDWGREDIRRTMEALREIGFATRLKFIAGKPTAIFGWRRRDALLMSISLFSSRANGYFWKPADFVPTFVRRSTEEVSTALRAAKKLVRLRRYSQAWQSATGRVDRVWFLHSQSRRVFGLWVVPESFFIRVHVASGYTSLYIPDDVEGYLMLCYGENWRTPNGNWNTWRDDGRVWHY